MGTLELLQVVVTGEPTQREAAHKQLDGREKHYLPLLQSLASLTDNRLTLWALYLIVEQYPLLLRRDAGQAIPLLLNSLATGDGPIIDRATWALSIIGEAGVKALLAGITAAPETDVAATYMGALRRNASVYLLATEVLALLEKQLASSNEQVRYWALAVLMDIGPLRSWFDTRLPVAAFEALYGKLLVVAQEFVSSQHDGMASTYQELLVQALAHKK